MAYNKTTWVDNEAPYLNATNLNKMETGIDNNDAQLEINTNQIEENTEQIGINTDNILGLTVGEVYQGTWTPEAGTEYPASPEGGWSYYIQFLDDDGYTFTTGDLSGRIANNSDKIIYNGTSWSMIDNTNEQLGYYLVDDIESMLGLSPLQGALCQVYGYYSANDGGGGTFNYDSAQVGTNNGGTIIDGWVRQYSSNVDARWFGVSETDIDNTASMQNAVDFVTIDGGTIELDGGTFAFTTQLTLKDNVTIELGNSIIDMSDNDSFAGWYALGTIGAEATLTIAATKGDTTINAPTAGLAAGDWLLLKGDKMVADDEATEQWRLGEVTSGTTSPYFSEPVQIVSIINGSSFTIATGLIFPNYTDSGSRLKSTIQKLTFVDNTHVKNGVFIARTSGDAATSTGGCIRLNKTINSSVQGSLLKLGDKGTSAIVIQDSMSAKVDASAERPSNWELVQDHSRYTSFKDIGAWYSVWEMKDLNGSQGFDQTFASGEHPCLYPIAKMHSVNSKEDAMTTHGCCYGGKFEIESFGARYAAIRNRARFSDIKVHSIGASTNTIAGITLSSWGGLDVDIHDSFVSGHGYGVEYDPAGVTDTSPALCNMTIDNVVLDTITMGDAIRFVDRVVTNNEPSNIKIKDVTLRDCHSGIEIGNFVNGVHISNVDIIRLTDVSTRYGIEMSIDSAGHKIDNVRGINLGYGNVNNTLIRAGSATDANAAFAKYGYTALVDWGTVRLDISFGGEVGVLSSTGYNVGFYFSTSTWTPQNREVGQLVMLATSGTCTVTIPATTDIPRGGWIDFMQYNTGQVTFDANGQTLHSPAGLSTLGQGAVVRLTRIGTTTWSLSGNATT